MDTLDFNRAIHKSLSMEGHLKVDKKNEKEINRPSSGELSTCEIMVIQKDLLWTSNSTPGHVSEKMKASSKAYMYPMFITALFAVAKVWKQPKCPSTGRWMKLCCIYTMGYYSAIKKNEILPSAATWMGLEGIRLSELG